MKIEHKTFPLTIASIDYEGRTFTGYAAVFGNIDSYDDIIHMGAFSKTLSERGQKVRLLWQHDTQEPLGKPVLLKEDDNGLFVECIISDTARGRDALALLRDGAIGEMSIGYEAIQGGTEYGKALDGRTVRNLKEIKLWEISLVTFAANDQAVVTGLKSEEEPETKAGRAISAANGAEMMACMDDMMSGMAKMQGAHDRLMEMMKRAGMMDSEDEEMPDEEMSKSAPDQAAEEIETLEEKAGPVNPPTSNTYSVESIIAEIAELELLEVTRHGNHSN